MIFSLALNRGKTRIRIRRFTVLDARNGLALITHFLRYCLEGLRYEINKLVLSYQSLVCKSEENPWGISYSRILLKK